MEFQRKDVYVYYLIRSSDGTILMASSTDGYCSIIHFQKGELGEEYKVEDTTSAKLATDNCKHSSEPTSTIKKAAEGHVPTIDIDNNAMDFDIAVSEVENISHGSSGNARNQNRVSDSAVEQEGRPNDEVIIEETEDIKLVYSEESTNEVTKVDAKDAPKSSEQPSIISNKTPRRVQLITLWSPKGPKKD